MTKVCPYCQRDLSQMQGLRRARHYPKCAAQVGRNAKREDPEEGLRPKDEHAVPPEEAGCAQTLPGDPS
jgi:hypothetical protein